MSSLNFAQPDITLSLDAAGVIRRAVLSAAIADEAVTSWVGQRLADTLNDGDDHVQQMLDDAWSSGVSPVCRVRQRFASGREMSVEYTAVRLGTEGLIAIGRSLEAVAHVRTALSAAKTEVERSSWKGRELVGQRCRLLSDTTNLPVLLVHGDDLRVLEANPAAIRALDAGVDGELLLGLSVKERDAFQAMLRRLRAEGTAPGLVVHLGPTRTAWLLRASLIAEWAPVFMLHLAPAGLAPAVLDATAEELPAPSSAPAQDLGRQAMRNIVEDAVAAVERDCILAVLQLQKGNRQAVADMMGISVSDLDAKLAGPKRK
jgi:hypothetical protein